MSIENITAIATSQPPAPVPAAAAVIAPEAIVDLTALEAVSGPPAPPPPSPGDPAHFDVEIAEHEATGLPMYRVVDADSGDTIVQIPPAGVLNLVAEVLRRLQEDGRA